MLDLAGPPRCAGCRAVGEPLCSACARDVPPCPPLEAPPPLERLAAGTLYEGGGRALVLGLKLGPQRCYALPLARLACRSAWRDGIAGDLVTWVPGDPDEARRRGYDHGEVLARAVARLLGLRAVGLLRLNAPKADQTTLGAAQRRQNPKGAFVARSVHGKVVLVDDVMTTGATICACASALSGAGAGGVHGLVGCRV